MCERRKLFSKNDAVLPRCGLGLGASGSVGSYRIFST